jgi:hypothetical protein
MQVNTCNRNLSAHKYLILSQKDMYHKTYKQIKVASHENREHPTNGSAYAIEV